MGGRGSSGGSQSFSGITDTDWMNWAEDPEIFQAALNGTKKPTHSQADGHTYTQKEWNRAKKVAPEIQHLSESGEVSENTLFRGESFESLLEARRVYKIGATITNKKLTSYTTNPDIATAYAEGSIDFMGKNAVKVVVTNTNVNNSMRGSVGIKTDPFRIGGSAEVITPKGLKSKVVSTSFDKESKTLFVRMENTAKPKRRKK